MWELDHKEDWVPKNRCFWTVVLEKAPEGPLDYKEIKPVNPKGNQPWIFTGRNDAEAQTPILRPPDAKNWLIGKDPDVGKDWRQEKGTKEQGSWKALLTQWMWVWASSKSWSWTGRPGMLWSMGSQRVGHNWATELNWTTLMAESEEELKKSLDEGQRGEWKSLLKTQHSKMKIMVSISSLHGK